MKKLIYIEACNYDDYPHGGQITFAKQFIQVCPYELAIVGVSTDDTPVGEWTTTVIDNKVYDFFSLYRAYRGDVKPPLVPARLRVYLALKKYKQKILSIGVRHCFIRASEVLFAVHKWKWASLCYHFPGVINPMPNCRYWWGRLLGGYYDKVLFNALSNVDVILAASDESNIKCLVDRSHGKLDGKNVVSFPTRVDVDKVLSNSKRTFNICGIKGKWPLLVTVGRICKAKGLDLLIGALEGVLKKLPQACLLFIGDGEERSNLNNLIKSRGLSSSVVVVGFVHNKYIPAILNKCDVYLVGSLREGWSNSMLEALASNLPIVSTGISGASDIVHSGRNGYVLDSRDPQSYADAIIRAMSLQNVAEFSRNHVNRFDVKYLFYDLAKYWKQVAD